MGSSLKLGQNPKVLKPQPEHKLMGITVILKSEHTFYPVWFFFPIVYLLFTYCLWCETVTLGLYFPGIWIPSVLKIKQQNKFAQDFTEIIRMNKHFVVSPGSI